MSMNANDVLTIQECLCSYKALLKWLPVLNDEEDNLKYIRLQCVSHLIEKCDDVLEEMKNE